jgi:hypothetical protein
MLIVPKTRPTQRPTVPPIIAPIFILSNVEGSIVITVKRECERKIKSWRCNVVWRHSLASCDSVIVWPKKCLCKPRSETVCREAKYLTPQDERSATTDRLWMNRDKPAKDNCVCELIVLARVSAVTWHGHCLTNLHFHIETIHWKLGSSDRRVCPYVNRRAILISRCFFTNWFHYCRYALVKLFEPFGKITLMDFLFHFSGPKRGQPRGYCFLEYSSKQVKKPEEFKNIHIQLYKCKLSPRSRLTKG